VFTRFLFFLVVITASLPARADEPSTTSRGIAAEAKLPESERVLTVAPGQNATVHLRNDTGEPVVFQALAGDCASGRAVLHTEQVLVYPTQPNSSARLVSWLQRSLVFYTETPLPFLLYIAKPNDEFDVAIALSALRDTKDPKSPRIPLSKGTYRVLLDLYKADDFGSASQRGLPPEPLLTYIIRIQ